MSLFTLVTLALATGFAIAKPVHSPQSLPMYPKRSPNNNNIFSKNNNNNNNNNFNLIDGFQNFNEQQQVVQIQQQSLQIVDNGRQQAVVEQVNQVLIIDQQNNGRTKDMNNLFRKSNFRNNKRDVSTVMLVVQEIQVAIDDGQGNQFQQNVFAQSVLVANRGSRNTETVMIFEAKTLIAQNIINGNNNNNNNNDNNNNNIGIGGTAGVAGATGAVALPTKTNDVQLLGAKPTWSSVAEDPAATLGGIWEAELQDLQNNAQDGADGQINGEAAALEKAVLEASQQ